MEYREFLQGKAAPKLFRGIEGTADNPHLFDYQRDIVNWALRRGCDTRVSQFARRNSCGRC